MLDTDQQLARLRQRVAAIDSKYANRTAAEAPVLLPSIPKAPIEDCVGGAVASNEHGEHFQTDTLLASHRTHGSADIGALSELPHDLLCTLSENAVDSVPPERWAFLDTETTGLAGGSGTYAFLIGVGGITQSGFKVRQFFMRDYAEEKSLLTALHEYLQQFDVLVTYNGKSYDQPLLETRFRMVRQRHPFARMPHLDLLYGARRLWKLRLEGCRLVQLEQQILGYQREGDVPGELIPYIYFDYVRSRNAQRLMPVFHHNVLDIVTLACLTAIVPAAFRKTDEESLRKLGVKRGEELLGIARWLVAANELEQAVSLMKRAIEAGLPDALLFRCMWDAALLEKKLKRPAAALTIFTELSECRNAHRVAALEELAKYYEHEERKYALALDFTEQALRFERTDTLQRRRERLERRLAKPGTRRLL